MLMRKVILPCWKRYFLPIVTCFLTLATYAQPTVIYDAVITEGLNGPMEVKSAPADATGRLFIVEKRGTVKIWDGAALLPTLFIDISSMVTNSGEQGLLSMAFHPQYVTNGFFFLYYNNSDGDITVSRFKVSDGNENVADPDTVGLPLVQIDKPFTNHNGGHLQFKVENNTNYLYFGTGDGGSSNDPNNNAQNPASLLGKMIRVDVDEPDPVTPEVWSIGLRNPFRWSFDRENGDMWIGDVGQGRVEEVNYLEGGTEGANFGWRCFEGTQQNTDVDPLCDPPGKIPPVLEYDNPTEGRSVVGGYVYRGSIDELQGYYLATDFFERTLWLIQKNGSNFNITTQDGLAQHVTSISEVENGDLYITKSPGMAGEPGDDSVFMVITNAVVPLKLTHFSAKANAGFNDLEWTTVMEQNINRFVIEYSNNGTEYAQAGIVQATNNATGASYAYRHSINTDEKIFYRLRVEEFSGHVEYSAIITVGNGSASDVKVYPTIINNNILQINSSGHISTLRLYSIQGKEVFSKNFNNSSGYFTVSLPSLQKGMYVVRLTMNGVVRNQRIIVQ